MRMFSRCLRFAVSLVLFVPVYALAAPGNVTIGDASISLPDGAKLVATNTGKAFEFAQTTIVPRKRLLMVWVGRDQRIGPDAYYPVHYRYADAYTMRALEQRNVSVANFSHVKTAMRVEMDGIRGSEKFPIPNDLGELRSKLSKINIDPDQGVSLGIVSVQMLKDDSDRLSDLFLVSAALGKADSASPRKWMLMCTSQLLLKGKIITLNVFSEFTGADDRNWVETQCDNLSDRVLAANR